MRNFPHSMLWSAVARHNFKWVQIKVRESVNRRWVSFNPITTSYLIAIFTHLTLYLADAVHNIKWVKIIQIWQNDGQRCWHPAGWCPVLSLTCTKAGIYNVLINNEKTRISSGPVANPYSAGIYRRQILTTNVDPRTVRGEIFLMAVDP